MSRPLHAAILGPALLFVATFLPASSLAGFIDQSRELARLTGEVSYRVDRGSETPFERISEAGDGWISQKTNPFLGSSEPVRLWARFELPAADATRRIYIVTGPWERVEYFFVKEGKLESRQLTGSLVPASQRQARVAMAPPFLVAGFAAVDVPARATVSVYARLASDNRLWAMQGLRFSLWDEAAVRGEETRDRLVQGLFLGAMLLLLAYNLALYLLDTRDASHLYFSIGLGCTAGAWLSLSGLGFDLFWPESPAWDRGLVLIAVPVGIFAFLQFMRRYLDTARHLPRHDALLKWVGVGSLVLPPMVVLVSANFPIPPMTGIAFIWIPAAIAVAAVWVCISAYRRRLPFAGVFLIAVGCSGLGNLVSTLPFLGVPMPLLLHASQFGVVVMGTMLTIGMGLRMRDLRIELASRQVREARIEGERRQAEQANKYKSEFLANMSHELRTPLNAIIGFSDVMLGGMAGKLEGKQREFVGDIRDSGGHLLSLINDILDLSKVEAGRMELDRSRFDVAAAIGNAVLLVRGRAERCGVALAAETADVAGEFVGDERKFKQIVLNLLSNAVKFTPEGGEVTVRARRTAEAVEVSVSDTGIGIAPEDRARVFEEFRQVGGDHARKAEGTGLGLTLTKKLVELHGGHIDLESEPGKGSTFTFTLPMGQP